MRHFFFLSAIFFYLHNPVFAQVEKPAFPPGEIPLSPDTTNVPAEADTLPPANRDTLQASQDTIPPAVTQSGDIETTIQYSARDSIRASTNNKKIWLYGEAKIKYGTIELEADMIIIDYDQNTLTAHGTRDSLGRRVGYPVFKDGSELYETKDIVYNFETGRAKISEVVTRQGEGILHVATAWKNEKDELFSVNNAYTTCDLEHPHFLIRSTKSKAIPDDKIVSGPFYLEFNSIPLPIGFLFGMFPAERESKSGIIFPSYGEERRRGFALRNFGYFFDVSEYLKIAVTGDVYSKGGHGVYFNTTYAKRYHYTGAFNLSYTKTPTNDQIENRTFVNDYRLVWSHSPKSRGNSRFSSSVNIASNSYNQNNNLAYGYNLDLNSTDLNNTTRKLSSSVSYSTKFPGTPFSLGINGSVNQDLVTGLVDLPFPNLTVNMTNQYPFQRKDGKITPLDNFSVGYNMAATNRITNNIGRVSPDATTDSIAPFTMENLPLFLERARTGVRHSIPISTSNRLFRYFTISPSINYEEKWYFQKLDWRYETYNNKPVLVADTLHGFNRIANYNISAGINTRVYGLYFFKRGNVQAIRHVINPTIGYGYTPNFAENDNYYQLLTDPSGREFYKARHEGFVYGPSITGHSSAINFGLGNNLEMKVKRPDDSVSRKVMLINNLSFNSGYNFVADSFNLRPISIAANTNIKDNLVNINLNANLDPYTYVVDDEGIERRIDSYAWKSGSLGRITSANLAMSTNFNPKAREQEQATREKIVESDLSQSDKDFLLRHPEAYVDFDIPWRLQLAYNLNYTHPLNRTPQVTQSIQMSGEVALTEKWKINFNSGFHIESGEFTQTTITAARDLHCWTMLFWWVPFGKFQSYNFTINVKSSMLKDLKLERRKPFLDNL